MTTRSWHGWHRHVSLVMLAFVPNIDLTALRVGFKREDVVSLAYMRSRTGLLRASSRYQKSEFRFFSGCALRLSRVRRRTSGFDLIIAAHEVSVVGT